MTSIQDNVVNRRVLIDWDADGFFNVGVPVGTPVNEFPASTCPIRSNVAGWESMDAFSNYTVTPANDEYGFYERSVALGANATVIRMMFEDYKRTQPHAGDPTNVMPNGATNGDLSSINQALAVPVTGATPVPAIMIEPWMPTTEYVGKKISAIPYNSALGGIYWSLGYRPATPTQVYAAAGYNADPNYSFATTPAYGNVNFGGIDVQASHNYVLVFQLYVPSKSVNKAYPTGAPVVSTRVYSNNYGSGSSPYYGRRYLGKKNDFTPDFDTWITCSIPVTTYLLADKLAFDMQIAGSMTGGVFIGGMMLLDTTAIAPTRGYVWDNGEVFSAEQFTRVFENTNADHDYVLTFHVKSPNGITKLKPKLYKSILGTNTTTSTTPSDITVTSSWSRVNIALPIRAATDVNKVIAYWLTFTAEKSGVTVVPGVTGDVVFKGFQLTEGTTTTYPYHNGLSMGYDDVTDLTLSVTTKAGKKDFMSGLPDDGTCTIVLNNQDQRFSPSNTDSPLYNWLLPNNMVKVQVFDGSAWQTIWAGWTDSYDITPGTTSDVRAEITCTQGVQRMSEGGVMVPIEQNLTLEHIVPAIIENSGFRTTAIPETSTIGTRTLTDNSAHVRNSDAMYSGVETGINIVEVAGKDWSKLTDPRKAVEQILEAEGAQMWINRDGTITIVNRNHWIVTAVDDTIYLDRDVSRAEYRYGEDLINNVEVKVARNKITQNETVWATRRAVKLNRKQVWVAELNPQYTEGSVKTVINYTLDGMTKTVYNKDPGILNDTSSPASTGEAAAVVVELLGTPGVNPRLRVTNTNGIPMWLQLSIKGSYVSKGDDETVIIENEDAEDYIQGKHTKTYTNPVISDQDQAISYGDYLIMRKAYPVGEFTSITIPVRNSTDLSRVLALSVGSIISLYESQSTESGVSHAIIGETFNLVDSRTLTVTYNLARTLQERFANVDNTNVETLTTNEVDDMYTAAVLGGGGEVVAGSGTEYGTEKILVWRTGNAWLPQLILHPATEQVQVFKPNYGIELWPKTDAAGNAFQPVPYLDKPSNESDAAYFNTWVIPTGNTHLAWYGKTRKTMTGTGTAFAGLGMLRSKTTDESVGAAASYDEFVPVVPSAIYHARGYYVLRDPNQLPAGTNASGMALDVVDRKGLLVTGASSTAGGGGTSLWVESLRYVDTDFTAKDNAGTPITAVGLKTYKKANVFEAEAFMRAELLRKTKNAGRGAIQLTAGVTYLLTMYAISMNPSTTVTLTIYDDTTGNSIVSQSFGVSDQYVSTFTRTFPVPAGNGAVWVGLEANTGTTYYDDKEIRILAWHIGANVAAPSLQAILAEQAHDTIYV